MSTAIPRRATDFGDAGGGHWQDPFELAARRARTGLMAFMAVVTSLFFLFFLALMIRSQYADWEPLTAPWRPLANATQLWLNTAVLAAASIALQMTVNSARHKQSRSVVIGLALAGVFTLAFLIGQWLVWRQLAGEGYVAAGNPANAFFYLLTGLHGLHLAGGLVAWARTSIKAWNRPAQAAQLHNSIVLCALYWHFMFAVWLLLFGLLASSPETFETLARLCGLR